MEDTSFALPVTPKQIAYARSLALRNQTLLPWEVQQDRRALSSWIDAQARLKPVSTLDQLPSSKQVAFAERLARIHVERQARHGVDLPDLTPEEPSARDRELLDEIPYFDQRHQLAPSTASTSGVGRRKPFNSSERPTSSSQW